jgi:hypothetical protein
VDNVKIADSRAAAQRYDIRQDRLGKYPEVPDDIGPIHALLYDPPGSEGRRLHPRKWLDEPCHEPVFLEWSDEEAACGRRVRLVFPVSFDTGEPDACPHCLEMVDLWVTDRAECDRRVSARHDRWREEERARADYEDFRRRQEQDLDTPARDDRSIS